MDPTPSHAFLISNTEEPDGPPTCPEPPLQIDQALYMGEADNLGDNPRIGVIDHQPLWRGSAWYATVRGKGLWFNNNEALDIYEMIVAWDVAEERWTIAPTLAIKGVGLAQHRFTPEMRDMILND